MKYTFIFFILSFSLSALADKKTAKVGEFDPSRCACETCLVQHGVCVPVNDSPRTAAKGKSTKTSRKTNTGDSSAKSE